MTDNQSSSAILQKIVDGEEILSPSPAESNQEQRGEATAPEGQMAVEESVAAADEELTPELQAAQLEAEKAKQEAALAHIRDLEKQQVALDQEEILALRGELPEVSQAKASQAEGEVPSDNTQELKKKDPDEEIHQVEQLQRLD